MIRSNSQIVSMGLSHLITSQIALSFHFRRCFNPSPCRMQSQWKENVRANSIRNAELVH